MLVSGQSILLDKIALNLTVNLNEQGNGSGHIHLTRSHKFLSSRDRNLRDLDIRSVLKENKLKVPSETRRRLRPIGDVEGLVHHWFRSLSENCYIQNFKKQQDKKEHPIRFQLFFFVIFHSIPFFPFA